MSEDFKSYDLADLVGARLHAIRTGQCDKVPKFDAEIERRKTTMSQAQHAIMEEACSKATIMIEKAFNEAHVLVVEAARKVTLLGRQQLEEQLRTLEAQVLQIKAQLGQ